MKRYTIKPLEWETKVHEDQEYYEAETPFVDLVIKEQGEFFKVYENGEDMDLFYNSLEEAMEDINQYWKGSMEQALVEVVVDNGDGYY